MKIQKAMDFLNEKFKDYIGEPHSIKYRYEHSIRVANIARIIAEAEGFNVDAFVIASLLHDIGYVGYSDDFDWVGHGRISSKLIKDFIYSLDFDEATTNDILYGIAIHVDGEADFAGEKTPFALAITDADNIDRLDAYRIFETLMYGEFHKLELSEQKDICIKRIFKYKNLLEQDFATPTSTKMLHEKIRFEIDYYSRVLSQLNNSSKIIE